MFGLKHVLELTWKIPRIKRGLNVLQNLLIFLNLCIYLFTIYLIHQLASKS